MVNKSANTFDAAARSLRMTVTPALGESNSLAAEQVRVIAGVLDFYRDRAHHEYPRKQYEFRTYLALAERLSDHEKVDHAARSLLADALENARRTDLLAVPEYGQLDRATDELTRAIAGIVRSARTTDRTRAPRSAASCSNTHDHSSSCSGRGSSLRVSIRTRIRSRRSALCSEPRPPPARTSQRTVCLMDQEKTCHPR